MKARVKNLKLQAKTAIMIMAPKKAKALLWVVATKPLPVRRLSSVGVRRDGRASRILFFGDALRSAWVNCWLFPSRAYVAQAKLAWVTAGFAVLPRCVLSRRAFCQRSRYVKYVSKNGYRVIVARAQGLVHALSLLC